MPVLGGCIFGSQPPYQIGEVFYVRVNVMMRVRKMGKQTVSDAVLHSDLEQVEFHIEPLTLTLTGKNGLREAFALRVFVPECVPGGCQFITDMIFRLRVMLERTTGEEHDFYQYAIQMLRFYLIYPELDPHRTRHFNLKTLDHSETFRGLAAHTRTKRLTQPERLIKFAGETTDPTSRLLLNAIYIRPDLSSPLMHPDYIAFREQCLSEMMSVMEWIEGMKRDAIEQLRRGIESDPTLSADQRSQQLDTLASLLAGEAGAELREICQDVERLVLKEALELEDRQSVRFADLVQEARRLQEPIGREVAEKHIELLAEDGVSLTPEYASCIQERLDTSAVNWLLWQTILRFEEVYGLEPLRDLELVDLPGDLDELVLDEDLEEQIDQELSQEPEFEEYLGFWQAYLSDDILEKWYMTCWITAHLVNRNECIRMLQREAESVYHGVLDYAFREIYRKIRRHMTVPERRAYALLYFRLPIFNPHVAVMNPIIMSFFADMDEQTQTLVLLVLVFKRREWGGEKDLDKELERRWRAYLKFYPAWLEIIQDDDREAKRQQTIQKCTLSLHHPDRHDKGGKKLTLEDRLPDPKSRPANLLQAIILGNRGTIEEWAQKYCTPIQSAHVLRRFRDEKTQEEIAKEEGITQQAVSKSILGACNRIREGLIRDGILETG